MTTTNDSSRWLRLALRANAAFSTLSAAVFLAAAAPIAAFLGILSVPQVLVLGVQLALFAAWLFWLSQRPAIPPWQVRLIIALDVLWVVGSFQTILAPPPQLTGGGKWAIGMVADLVALFALLQFMGLRRIRRSQLATGT